MAVSILACPSCKTWLLSDTVQCPACQLVLDQNRLDEVSAVPSFLTPVENETECPSCNEMVRAGLVRCWNCGSFLRSEIADAYKHMQENPTSIIYSELPTQSVEESVSAGEEGTYQLAREVVAHAEDDDFELSADVASSDYSGFLSEPSPAASVAAPTETESAMTETPPQSSTDQASPAETPPVAEDASAEPAGNPDQEAQNDEAALAGMAHSDATGGDVLLDVAIQEEAETHERRRMGGRLPRAQRQTNGRDGFLVYCPNGHRIEVQEHHRGKSGRCPRCKATFIVPTLTSDAPQPDAAEAPQTTETKEKPTAGKYTHWQNDVHVHSVDTAKLKLKPGSLSAAFEQADLGFSSEGLLEVTLLKKGGSRGAEDKKTEVRAALFAHLNEDKPVDSVPVAGHHFFSAEQLQETRLAQPVRYAHESMFAGVPVFGEGRIAVMLPKFEENAQPEFLSFALSEFRQIANLMQKHFGITGLEADSDIPMTDEFATHKCHYSDEPLKVLEQPELYLADPNLAVKLIGRKCASCGLVVSEDSRKKERIGGKAGRGIAKSKCPKCKKPFGDISLYTLEKPVVPPDSDSTDVAGSEQAADDSTAEDVAAQNGSPEAAQVAGGVSSS